MPDTPSEAARHQSESDASTRSPGRASNGRTSTAGQGVPVIRQVQAGNEGKRGRGIEKLKAADLEDRSAPRSLQPAAFSCVDTWIRVWDRKC
jgi:hypothetical protein